MEGTIRSEAAFIKTGGGSSVVLRRQMRSTGMALWPNSIHFSLARDLIGDTVSVIQLDQDVKDVRSLKKVRWSSPWMRSHK
jgi:hypothetical protein